MNRWKILLYALGAMQCFLSAGCDAREDVRIMAIQRKLEDSGFIELPYGFQISEFTMPPCRGIAPPMPSKHPAIWLINGQGSNVAMIPSRSESGEYSLVIQESPLPTAKSIATLSATKEIASVFLTRDGSVVEADGKWGCALFFLNSGEGVVAWRARDAGFIRVVQPDVIPQEALQRFGYGNKKELPPCYRRFYLKGRKNTSGPSLLHEIWPETEKEP